MFKLHFVGRFLQQLEAFKRGDAVAALAGPESLDVGKQASQEQDVVKIGAPALPDAGGCNPP